MDAILLRRSIRRYTNEPVSEEHVKKLLEYAMAAPSAHNQQPWQFIVVNDRQTLDKIPNFHPYSQMLKEAPLAIVVCGDTQRMKAEDFWPQDCAAATENILVGATSLGLGTCWCGVYPKQFLISAVRDLLNIPSHIIPFCIIAVGHPAEQKRPSGRFDPSRIHHNRW